MHANQRTLGRSRARRATSAAASEAADLVYTLELSASLGAELRASSPAAMTGRAPRSCAQPRAVLKRPGFDGSSVSRIT